LHRVYAAPAGGYTAAQLFATFHSFSPLAHTVNRSSITTAQALPAFGEIETSKLYCANSSNCAFTGMGTPEQVAQIRYAEVALVYLNGVLSGRPDGIVLVCGRNYVDSAGNLHDLALHDFVGDAAAQAVAPFDPGTMSATGYAPGSPTESTTGAKSSMQVFTSNDTVFNTQGHAVGYQITDNVDDVALFGGADIYLTGQMDDMNETTGVDTPAGFGIMSCSTRTNAPPLFGREDSEAVTQENDGD
jgi:hypothetical protein